MKDATEIDTGEFPLSLREAELPQPPSSSVRIDVAALSDKGKVRERNEDHYYVARGGRHVTTLITNVPPDDLPSQFTETAGSSASPAIRPRPRCTPILG